MSESDEGTQEHGAPQQKSAPASKQKKPSGQQFRIARRERTKAAADAQARRKENGTARPRKKCVPAPANRTHLQMLEFLAQLACDIMNDGEITEEDRRKQLNDNAHAQGKISVNAECERESEEMKDLVIRERDELQAAKQRVLVAEKRLLCPECGAKTKKSSASSPKGCDTASHGAEDAG